MSVEYTPYGRVDRDSPPKFEVFPCPTIVGIPPEPTLSAQWRKKADNEDLVHYGQLGRPHRRNLTQQATESVENAYERPSSRPQQGGV